ncbi:MAG: N-acetylmuramoyl-L-alanine amidase [Veillonellales bacterium]
MRILSLSRRNLQKVALLSVAVVALNLLALRYLVLDDVDDVDLTLLSGHVVALDPGHGGIDSGARANGFREKDITMAIAEKLTVILQENGAQVFLTRDSDVDYYTPGKGGKRNDLMKRVEIIEASGAQVYVSIHCNAIQARRLSGAQVFYSPKLEENKMLAEGVQRALKKFPPGNKRQAKQDLHILVLNAMNRPGILVEAGYLTNQTEAGLLADSGYQQKLAEQIAKGLAYHFSQNAGR